MSKTNIKHASKIFDTLCRTLDAEKWLYDKDEEEMRVKIPIESENHTFYIVVQICKGYDIIRAESLLPVVVPESRKHEFAVAIAKANYGMKDGNFDYDQTDGFVFFRMSTGIRKSLISEEVIKCLIYSTCIIVDDYIDKFLEVAHNNMTCAEVAKFID